MNRSLRLTISFFLASVVFISAFSVCTFASTANHTQKEAVKQINDLVSSGWGSSDNVPNYDKSGWTPGDLGEPQCVDLIAYYWDYLVGYHKGLSAYQYCNLTASELPEGWSYQSRPAAGDIVVWNQGQYGHIGIVTEVSGNQYWFVDTNGDYNYTVDAGGYRHNTGARKRGPKALTDATTFLHPVFKAETVSYKNGFNYVDGQWKYYKNQKLQKKLTGIIKGTINGKAGWYYVKNGVYKKTTRIAKRADGSNTLKYYVKNGKYKSYTGMVVIGEYRYSLVKGIVFYRRKFNWANVYIKYLKSLMKKPYFDSKKFALLYLDNDSIPELLTGENLFCIKNGKRKAVFDNDPKGGAYDIDVASRRDDSLSGWLYKQKKGILYHGGGADAIVYQGYRYSGGTVKRVLYATGLYGFIPGTSTGYYTWTLNGKPSGSDEAHAAKDAFTKSLKPVKAVSGRKLLKALKKYKN